MARTNYYKKKIVFLADDDLVNLLNRQLPYSRPGDTVSDVIRETLRASLTASAQERASLERASHS